MLVKELRQGMRSPIFVWGLISMNLFLAGVVWLTMNAPEEMELHMAFFGGFCALVCGLLPLRAAGALHDELRGNTIDTLILTRLTGWRITLGKWVAVVAQQILATVTVLPYLIVRYFVGGVNLPMELLWLGIFLLIGMGSAAILTGLSWIKYFLFRAAIMMGVTFIILGFCLGQIFTLFGFQRRYLLEDMFVWENWLPLALVVVPWVYLGFFTLDLGASKVGALVENRSLRRRVVGLAVVLFYGAAIWHGMLSASFPTAGSVVVSASLLGTVTVLMLALQALLERPLNLPVVVLPMVRRGLLGRLAGRFFYPGWPAGVCYIGALLGLVAGGFGYAMAHPPLGSSTSVLGEMTPVKIARIVVSLGASVGMLPIPLVLWQFFFRRRLRWHLGTYVLLMGAVLALMFLVTVGAPSSQPGLLKLGLPIPGMGVTWLAHSWEGVPSWQTYRPEPSLDWGYFTIAGITATTSVLWWLVAVLLAQRAFRETRVVEAEVGAMLAARGTSS